MEQREQVVDKLTGQVIATGSGLPDAWGGSDPLGFGEGDNQSGNWLSEHSMGEVMWWPAEGRKQNQLWFVGSSRLYI